MQKQVLATAVAVALMTTAVTASAASYIVLGKGGNLDAAVRAAGGTVTNRLAAIDAYVVEASGDAFKARMLANPAVQSVVPNLTIDWHRGEPRPDQYVSAEYGNPPNSGDDDIRFNLEWGHDAVDAVEAWNAGYRGAGATVAVLDGGFNLVHPDLAPSIKAGCTADFTGEGIAYGPNSDDPTGIFSHGSHVAGTVAAADNALGMIGVAPEAKLCLGKVLFNYGSGSFEDVVEGIIWAADQDVDVINMSLGGAILKSGEKGFYTATEAAELKNFIARAVAYALKQGTLVIASAGNDASDGDKDRSLIHLPSDAPGVMSISATAPIGWATPAGSSLDYPASYTNYGRSVISVAAPGGDFSYAYINPSQLCTIGGLTRPCYVFDYVFSTGGNVGGNNYYFWSAGTSMASPHASGVAAIAVSKYGHMAPAQLRTLLERSADDLGQPGNDPFYGAGRLNAAKAVQ
jgi:subtilisin family serine protease